MTDVPKAGGDCRPLGTLSDEELVSRVLEGQTSLFEILIRRYNQRLFRVTRAVTKDASEAEDVMQQTYVAAYSHLGQFAGRARFSTWLTKIAVHEALARVRRRGREASLDADADGWQEGAAMHVLQSEGPSPEEQAQAEQTRQLLESAIDALPEIYRTVFVLREVEGLDTAETAGCLGIREDAVKTRLSRARALLREELFERTGASGSSAFSFHLSRCDRMVASVFEVLGITRPRVH
jgi:RNA polymerase sigma-70 factor (ECF subfamily)